MSEPTKFPDAIDVQQKVYSKYLAELNISNLKSTQLIDSHVTNLTIEESEKISVSKHWWGVDIKMNEKLTKDIIDGITGAGPLGTLIAAAFGAAGVITGGIATILGAGIAGICAAKAAQIKITDNGKGVHWPITWIQWGILLAALPGGPAGIIAAGMVFVHPVRN